MLNYKIVRISGIYYLSELESWLKENPEFEKKSYDAMLKLFFNSAIMYSDGFSKSFNKLGQQAIELVIDFEKLQKQWAIENGVSYTKENWMFDIMMSQINEIKPDVVYIQSHTFSIPGQFKKDKPNDNLIKILKDKYPFIRKVIIFSGYPSGAERIIGADIFFSSPPSIVDYYRKKGLDPILLYHSFDESILSKLHGTPGKYGFTFAGMSRAPESRYWALRQLMDQTVLEAWVYEHQIKISEKSLKQQINDTLKWFLKFIGDQRAQTIGNSKFVPKKISNIFLDILSERYYTTGKIVPLKKKYPGRCHSHVLGMDMYNLLYQSKITFNKHTDQAYGCVGNMRMFEATGIGTCLLTDNGLNMSNLFEPNKEVVTYSSIDEAVEKVRYMIDHPDKAAEIAKAGQVRTLKDHTIMNRCRQIDEVIQSKL